MRRGITVYALFNLGGVLSSYLVLEKGKLIEGLIVIAFMFICIINLKRIEIVNDKQLKNTLIFIVIGISVFSLSSISYDEKNVLLNYENDVVKGTVKEIEYDDNCYIIRIKPKSGHDILGYYYGTMSDTYEYLGEEVNAYGEVNLPDTARNPNCFNYRLYLKSKGIVAVQNIKSIKTLKKCNLLYELKKKILVKRNNFRKLYLDNPLADGILFGDKSLLSEEIYESFKISGIAHVLAVSGLHIGILFGFFMLIIRGSRNKLFGIIFLLLLFIYGIMTMFPPSFIRASVAIIISLIAYYYDLRYDMLSTISLVSLIMIIVNPYILFNNGFQLSFIAVTGICFYGKLLRTYLGSTLGTVIAAQLAVTPMIMYGQNYLTIIGVFSNLLIIPIISLIVPLLMSHLIIYSFLGLELNPLILINNELTEIVISINEFLVSYDFLVFDIPFSSLGMLIVYYSITFFIFSEQMEILRNRKNKKAVVILIIYIVIISSVIGIATKNNFLDDEIVFIDVGQGDGIHIRCDDKDVLIDGGGKYDKNLGKKLLKPYFLKNGVYHLDLAIPTHLHMDHFKAMKELNEIYKIDKVVEFKGYKNHEESIKGASFIDVGNEIYIGEETKIEILWPVLREGETFDTEDENKVNMVMKLYYGDITVLITGDLLDEGELDMVNYYKGTDKLKCDVLKICHHGSDSSSTDEFLDAVNPDIAIIQVGKNNYGHPSNVVIEKLKKRDIMLFRNDLNGTIGLDISGNEISVDTMIY